MILPKKVFSGVYYVACVVVVGALYKAGAQDILAGFVKPWAGGLDKLVYLGIFLAACVTLAALREQAWTLYLFMADVMAGTSNEPVFVREALRSARAAERRKDWRQAGKFYEEVERMEQAAAAYQQNRDWDAAARVLEAAQNFKEAAKMHEKAGAYEAAAQIYEKIGDKVGGRSLHQRAGDKAVAEGRLRPAAEHFIQAGQFGRAGQLLEQLEHWAEAAEIYLKDGQADRAADLYKLQIEKYEEALASGNPPPGGLSKVRATQAKAGEAYEAADRHKDAGEIAEALEDWSRAGMMYSEAGLHDKAADCFMKANDPTSAKQSMQVSGNASRIREFDAMEALEARNYKKAVELFLQLNHIEKAIDAARRGRDYESMGRIYEKTGRYVTAAEQYSMGRSFKKAAEMYEKGKDYRQAAEIYEQIGDMEKAIECLEIRRDFYTAGEIHQRQGNVRKAIACFQRIDRTDPNHQKACAALGALFTKEGQFDQAGGYFDKALSEGAPTDQLLDGYYQLAVALEEKGNFQEAGARYKKVMELDYSFKDAGDRYAALKSRNPQMFDSGAFNALGAQGGGGLAPHQTGGFQMRNNPPSQPSYDLGATPTSPGFGHPSGQYSQPPQSPPPGVQPLQTGQSWGQHPPTPQHPHQGHPAGGYQQMPPQGGPQFGGHQQQPPRSNSPQFAPTQMVNLMGGGAPPQHQGLPDQNDRYELIEEIGRGGMGSVFKARDKTLDRMVALKLLSPSIFSADGRGYDAFLREARAIAKLRHPNIVTVYDVGSRGDQYYLSMEYVSGLSLAAYVRQRGIPPLGRTVQLVNEICLALDHAHGENIVHRDIKPGNILVDDAGQVKIVDFGLAKIVGDVTVATGMVDPQSMQGGFVMGTPHYMSPEQIRGEMVDRRTDIYALGLTFYYMLIGQQLFDRFGCKSPMEIVEHQLNTALPSPREVNPALPREIDIVYYSCIEKDRNRRFASMRDVMAQLSAIPVD